MMRPAGRSVGGYSLHELAICLAVLAALAGLLLVRAQAYSEQAERTAVDQLVGTLRTALRIRVAEAGRTGGEKALRRLLEENPLDWLERKPDNYAGEYYAVETENIPVGNWVFDRRDKTLAYLPHAPIFYTQNATKFLKFKVESAQLYGKAPMQESRKQELGGLELRQISPPPAATADN